MMSDRSSMRMHSTSCCFNSACDATPPRFFNSAADMTYLLADRPLPVDLAADLAAPEVPGAHSGSLVDCIREPAFLMVERGHRRTAPERHGPMLDAGIDLSVNCGKYRRLQRRPACHAAVSAHEHDVLVTHDLSERHALGRVADQQVGGAKLLMDVEHGHTRGDKGRVVEHRLHRHADETERDHRLRMAVHDGHDIGPRLVDF